jgi:hypothetical protein
MITSTGRTTRDSERGGLLSAIKDPQCHPAMRRLGELAIRGGYTQEGLGKALREKFGLQGVNGTNVRAHFSSERPTHKTMARYAQILGLNDEQLYVIEHGEVPPDREPAWERELFRMLEAFKSNFVRGTAEKITDALRDPATRRRVFAAMAAPRTGWPLTKWVNLPGYFEPVAEALLPELDMREFVRKQTAWTNALLTMHAVAGDLYQNDEKARAFVDACAAIFRLDGIDTRPMYEMLQDYSEASAAIFKHGAEARATSKKSTKIPGARA